MDIAGRTQFAVDHMLVKLGKYLRILGYDAAWAPAVPTQELILQANREGRVFCTRNRRIAHEYPPPDRLLELASDDPVNQLRQVIDVCRLDPQARLFSRCIRCNRELYPVPAKELVRDLVHPHVYARHDRFYRCPACGTVFWRGSHVRNTCRKLGLAPPEEGGADG